MGGKLPRRWLCSSSDSMHRSLGLGEVTSAATFASIVKSCRSIRDCKLVHRSIISSKHVRSTFLANLLIQMYGKCGYLDDALAIFAQLSTSKNIFSYNIAAAALIAHNRLDHALRLFRTMLLDGIKPDVVSFVTAMGGCRGMASTEFVHGLARAAGHESNVMLATSAINLYGRNGRTDLAKELFDRMPRRNVVTWNSMITAYAQNGHSAAALAVFRGMSVAADEISFVNVLGACRIASDVQELHRRIVALGFHHDVVVGTALVTAYSKLGLVADAERAFADIRERNLVSWTAMLSAYVDHGWHRAALATYRAMRAARLALDAIVFVSALNACSNAGDLDEGRQLHLDMLAVAPPIKLEGDAAASLVNMYAKCGSLAMARKVFDKLSAARRAVPIVHQAVPNVIPIVPPAVPPDIVLWNTMLLSYAQNGLRLETLGFLHEMTLHGAHANAISFTGVLYACCHGGILDEGRDHFHSMIREFGIAPVAQHYGSMADLLARLGRLGDAEELLRTMPYEPPALTWTALLGACRSAGDTERAARLADVVPPETPSSYVLMSNALGNFSSR